MIEGSARSRVGAQSTKNGTQPATEAQHLDSPQPPVLFCAAKMSKNVPFGDPQKGGYAGFIVRVEIG